MLKSFNCSFYGSEQKNFTFQNSQARGAQRRELRNRAVGAAFSEPEERQELCVAEKYLWPWRGLLHWKHLTPWKRD